MAVTFSKVVMVTMEITDGFRVYEEGRWASCADGLGTRDEGEPGGKNGIQSLGFWGRYVAEESSRLPLICKCRPVFLKASRLTSLKTNAIFYFITVNSKAGLWRCSHLFAAILQSKSRTTEVCRQILKFLNRLNWVLSNMWLKYISYWWLRWVKL